MVMVAYGHKGLELRVDSGSVDTPVVCPGTWNLGVRVVVEVR